MEFGKDLSIISPANAEQQTGQTPEIPAEDLLQLLQVAAEPIADPQAAEESHTLQELAPYAASGATEPMLSAEASEVFEQMFTQHFKSVFRIISSKVGDPTIADDLTQITFIKALRQLQNGEIRNPLHWLTVVAVHTVADHFRHKDGGPKISLDQPDPRHAPHAVGEMIAAPHGGDTLEQQLIDRETVEAVLQQLSPQYRELFVRHYVDGDTCPEIAEERNAQPTAVTMQLKRARDQAKKIGKELLEGDW